MNDRHRTALRYHCRLGIETAHPRYRYRLSCGLSLVLTVNSGYE